MNELKTVDGTDSGLDADLLDGKHLTDIDTLYATSGQFTWCGFLYAAPGDNSLSQAAEKAIIEICKKYPNKKDSLFAGSFSRNSARLLLVHIYDTGNGETLPRYGMGIFIGHDMETELFNISEHAINLRRVTSSEYTG